MASPSTIAIAIADGQTLADPVCSRHRARRLVTRRLARCSSSRHLPFLHHPGWGCVCALSCASLPAALAVFPFVGGLFFCPPLLPLPVPLGLPALLLSSFNLLATNDCQLGVTVGSRLALNSTTRRYPRLGLVVRSRGPTQIHIRGIHHWAGEPERHLGAESPSRRSAGPASARKTSPPCSH